MSEPADLQRRFLMGVDRLGRALRVARQQIATQHRLSPLQLQLIEHIASHEPQRVGALAGELDVTQPTISDALDALKTKGLVERRPDPSDGRASIIALSDEGELVAVAVMAELAPIFEPKEVVDADFGVALHSVLTEIRRLQATGVISINRSCLSCGHYQPPATADPAHCRFLDEPLRDVDLRVDCSDHLSTTATD